MYVTGRTPFELAFSMSSLIGCCDSLNLNPCRGSSSFGGVISTPGIGPATEGLSGFELFSASQPSNDSSRIAGNAAAGVIRLMVDSPEICLCVHAAHWRAPMCSHTIGPKTISLQGGARLLGV